jgi:hypothetical protein
MLVAPGGYWKYQSQRRQYAPRYFEDRLAVASDVRMMQAWIRFCGHPGSQQAPFDGSRRQFVEQRLGLFQIECIVAFGEPAVDRSEQITGLLPLALIAPEPRKARCGAEFIGDTVDRTLADMKRFRDEVASRL